jgi:hypothetical protein
MKLAKSQGSYMEDSLPKRATGFQYANSANERDQRAYSIDGGGGQYAP